MKGWKDCTICQGTGEIEQGSPYTNKPKCAVTPTSAEVESAAKKHAVEYEKLGDAAVEAAEYDFKAGSAWRLQWVLELLRSREAFDYFNHATMTATANDYADLIERKAKGEM